jgi:gas vesicle protein
MAEQESTSGAIDRLTYLLIGAGIGATVALLFAPKSGRELRGDIADASQKGIEYGREGARMVGERATAAYDQAAQKATEVYGQTAQKAQSLVDVGKETLAAKREQLNNAIEAGKEAYAEEKQRNAAESGKSLGAGASEPAPGNA